METNNTTVETLTQAKWDKYGDRFVAKIRCGGRAAEMVGRQVAIYSKAKNTEIVTLGAVVADYGVGDVALFEVIR